MSDIVDVIYRLRDMAGIAADELRGQIKVAQAVLDKLDTFADDAQDIAQLSAASDLFPLSSALIPDRAGLVRAESPTPADQPPPPAPAALPGTPATPHPVRPADGRTEPQGENA